MINYSLVEETLGYQSSTEVTNMDKRLLVAGSKNVLVDQNKKVKTSPGYTRLGAGNTALTGNRNALTWHTSTGTEWPLRWYDDELEVYIGTLDGTDVDAWTRVVASLDTTNTPRATTWFDIGENFDLLLWVQGDDDVREWNGAIAIVSSITGTTITKTGTTTFAQNRFYTTRNKTLTCVRTGTDYTYTGGETTTTLTGIADTAGLIAGDILVQKVIVDTNTIASGRNNDTIYTFENQVCLGSEDDEEVHISKNSDWDDFTYSSPRLAGEGGLLTLDGASRALSSVGSTLLCFAGRSSIFKAKYEQITVGSTLAETLKVKKVQTGEDQGALNQECLVQVGNSIMYLSNEVALRSISDPDELEGIDPKTLSNPIKPDFDDEDWTNACAIWFKNTYLVSAPATSHVWMLEFVEDADGKLRRYWEAPQTLPVRPFSVINELLHGHSSDVPETYELFTGTSRIVPGGTIGTPEDKVPTESIARFSYNTYGKRANLKNFDEYYVDGEITPSTTDLLLTLNYDFDGAAQVIEKTIDGSDADILQGLVGQSSLGQISLGQNPMGGLLNPPADARKFRTILEIAKEDFHEIQAQFSTNEVDRYWAIISHGANAKLSNRRDTVIMK